MQSIQPYKDPRAPLRLREWMTQAGFVDVEMRLLPLPLTGWSNGTRVQPSGLGNSKSKFPADPRDHAIGVANRENVHGLLSSLAILPFTQRLG